REPERIEHGRAEAAVTDGERADRVAVVGAAEREIRRATGDALVRPELERDLERLFDRGGAIGGEEEVRLVDGDDRGERLGQFDRDAIAVAEERRVRNAVDLRPQRVVEL